MLAMFGLVCAVHPPTTQSPMQGPPAPPMITQYVTSKTWPGDGEVCTKWHININYTNYWETAVPPHGGDIASRGLAMDVYANYLAAPEYIAQPVCDSYKKDEDHRNVRRLTASPLPRHRHADRHFSTTPPCTGSCKRGLAQTTP
jgi:hypothetical protein